MPDPRLLHLLVYSVLSAGTGCPPAIVPTITGSQQPVAIFGTWVGESRCLGASGAADLEAAPTLTAPG